MILEHILVWRFMVLCVEMVHGVVALQEGYGIITDDIKENWLVESVYVMLQALSFDILFMWDHGSLGESP